MVKRERKGYLETAITGKRQEINLPTILNRTMLPKIWEFWCTH